MISYEEYCPYGNTSYQAGRSAVEVALKRYRYTGMERDEETGFSYHAARYYAVWLGRWASCEPIPLSDGTNLFAFVDANPVVLLDPSGHGPEEQQLGAKNEKAWQDFHAAVDERRVQKGFEPINPTHGKTNRIKGSGPKGTGDIIPDHIHTTPGGTNRILEHKGRHIQSNANSSTSKRAVDIRKNLKQANQQLEAAEAAGKVKPGTKAAVVRTIWDSDKGNASKAARLDWKKRLRQLASNRAYDENSDQREREGRHDDS